MTPAETEAYEMSLEMAFNCNPQRHRGLAASQSLIVRPRRDLAGTAGYVRSAEGTFFVLEAYDENQAGHCFVLAWFGGALTPGSYRVSQLSFPLLEEELDAENHSFFVFAAVRASDESATFVADSGSLEIESMQGGAVAGRFELSGFHVSSEVREDDVALSGSFRALEWEP